MSAAAPIRRVVIVGGGTAGWMTAAAMARLTAAGVSVTLVESEEIGTVGVGEATIPSLHDFNRFLDIDEDEFVRATGATFKLGIEFVDWAALGDRYIHPFGTHGRDVDGVARIEGRITHVDRDGESGFVRAVELADGRRIDGELFVDCSGFRALLLGEALGVPFVGWQHWLPCDRAVAVASALAGPLLPYTRASAERAGWRWRIPLQHRVGHGHVYASAFVDDDAAMRAVLDGLDGPALSDPRPLRFTAGVRERLWEGNCVAIGLSGGFLEPLESTSIHLIQAGIARLMSLFPDSGFAAVERNEYNRLLRTEYEQIRDFIILHYYATARDDSDFWNHCRTMAPPASLTDKMALWRAHGRIIRDQGGLFTDDSWIAVLMGQRVEPIATDPLVAALPVAEAGRFLHHLRDVTRQTAMAMPGHADFIARNCAARLTA